MAEAAFGENSPLGASLYAPSLRKLSVSSALQYRARTFVRSNLVVAASGISHSALSPLLEAHAAAVPSGGGQAATEPGAGVGGYVGGDVKVRTDTDGVSHMSIAFPAPAGEAGKQITQTFCHYEPTHRAVVEG